MHTRLTKYTRLRNMYSVRVRVRVLGYSESREGQIADIREMDKVLMLLSSGSPSGRAFWKLRNCCVNASDQSCLP